MVGWGRYRGPLQVRNFVLMQFCVQGSVLGSTKSKTRYLILMMVADTKVATINRLIRQRTCGQAGRIL